MSTDHHLEARLRIVDASDSNRSDASTQAALAVAHATLALVDAVRALKAGATATTTGTRTEYCVMRDGHAVFGWRGWTQREAESMIADLEDDDATEGTHVLGQRVVTDWKEAPRG